MKFEGLEIDGNSELLFVLMLQSAVMFKEFGKNREDFIDFAKGIWETSEMNDINELKRVLMASLLKNLKNYKK